VTTTLTVADGARIDWIPQETILFNHAALERRLNVHLAPGATLLLAEPLILGRAAMGEVVRSAHLRDRIAVWRGGAPLFADALRLDGDVSARMARPGTLDGAGALASVLLVSALAENHLGPARVLLTARNAGVSLIAPGVLFARLAAVDGYALRALLMPLVALLRGGPLPRVWTM
jgi:urease accessory protein